MVEAARFPNGLELRRAPELRAAGRQLIGYAATFGTRAAIGAFQEVIRAGAFRDTLAAPGRDVLALVDHDPGRLLARTSSGTLRLDEDAKGLAFSLDVPDTQLGRDVLALAQRGDLGGMSFAFKIRDEAWPAKNERELRAVDLVEISVVHAWPAYTQTSVAARSLSQAAVEVARRRRFLATL